MQINWDRPIQLHRSLCTQSAGKVGGVVTSDSIGLRSSTINANKQKKTSTTNTNGTVVFSILRTFDHRPNKTIRTTRSLTFTTRGDKRPWTSNTHRMPQDQGVPQMGIPRIPYINTCFLVNSKESVFSFLNFLICLAWTGVSVGSLVHRSNSAFLLQVRIIPTVGIPRLLRWGKGGNWENCARKFGGKSTQLSCERDFIKVKLSETVRC